jgi:hypothetical protein
MPSSGGAPHADPSWETAKAWAEQHMKGHWLAEPDEPGEAESNIDAVKDWLARAFVAGRLSDEALRGPCPATHMVGGTCGECGWDYDREKALRSSGEAPSDANAVTRGYATALANEYRRNHDRSGIGKHLRAEGLTVENMLAAGVNPIDVDQLRPCIEAVPFTSTTANTEKTR